MPKTEIEEKPGPKNLSGLVVRTFAVESDSRPGVIHQVSLWMTNWRGFFSGQLSCNCEAWLYQHQSINYRECKHTRQISAALKSHKDLVETTRKSEVFLKANLPTNGRLKALLDSVMAE